MFLCCRTTLPELSWNTFWLELIVVVQGGCQMQMLGSSNIVLPLSLPFSYNYTEGGHMAHQVHASTQRSSVITYIEQYNAGVGPPVHNVHVERDTKLN